MKRRNFLKHHHSRLYRSQRYQNPHFQKQGLSIQFRLLLSLLLVVVIAVGGVIGLTYAPILKIDSVEVTGLTNIPEEQLTEFINQQMQQSFLIFPQDSKIFLRKNVLARTLERRFDLKSATVSIDQSRLHVEAIERISEIVWLTEGKWYLVDLDGVVIGELSPVEYEVVSERTGITKAVFPLDKAEENARLTLQPDVPIIRDSSGDELVEGQQLLSSEMIENILGFDEGVRKLYLQPMSYTSEGTTKWLKLELKDAPIILFETTGSPKDQLEILKTILSKYHDTLHELTYIDIRFGNRVFVK